MIGGKPMELLRMEEVTKVYDNVIANKNVTFCVNKGEIHGLLGENGAGKSTLMSILSGVIRPTSGKVFWKGKEIKIASPQVSTKLGISMVHQHFMLVPSFSVVENVVLGIENKKLFAPINETAKKVKELSVKLGLEIEPFEKVGDLSIGFKQRVEIVKALYNGVELLILDEPTAVLTPQETEGLFKVLKQLKAEASSSTPIEGSGSPSVWLTSKTDTILNAGTWISFFSVTGLPSLSMTGWPCSSSFGTSFFTL